MKKKHIKILTIILCLTLIMGAFTACGSENKTSSENSVTFTDALGREVTVEKEPERVAALIGSFADMWVLSGGDVCATAEDAWEDFGLDLPDAVNIGGAHSTSLEKVLSSDPDFVIASASTSSNVDMQKALEDAGITVAYFEVDNFEDYLAMLDICTDITGRKDLYETNGTKIKEQIDTIKADFEDENISEEERTILLLRASSGFVKAKGSEGTVLGEMLADLGCINIADSDTSLLESLGVESVIEKNPHHIFVVTMGDDTEKAVDNIDQMMDENPAWGTLEAVEKDRMYIMDKKLFNNKPNAKWAESYEKLVDIFVDEK